MKRKFFGTKLTSEDLKHYDSEMFHLEDEEGEELDMNEPQNPTIN